MSRERRRGGIFKFVAGVGIGAGLGLLFAPRTGKETRRILKDKLEDLIGRAKEIDLNEVRENILDRVEEIKEELADLDKEKVIKIAKKQAKAIQKKAEELYQYALEKGTPIIEKAADEVRIQALRVVNDIARKLEKEETNETEKKTTKKTTKK